MFFAKNVYFFDALYLFCAFSGSFLAMILFLIAVDIITRNFMNINEKNHLCINFLQYSVGIHVSNI